MANNWRYYQQTGQVGGTTTLQYVDSFNGDDANSGAYNAPKQSIQGGLDVLGGTGTIVLAGYFNEGDFVGSAFSGNTIADGYVIIDGTGFNMCQLGINVGSQIGRLHIKDFFDSFFVNINSQVGVNFRYCTFENMLVRASRGVTNFNNNVLINSDITNSSANPYLESPGYTENNILLNGSVLRHNRMFNIRNNYIDETSKINCTSPLTPSYLNHNFYKGTAGDGQKIRVANVWYNNVEALQAATAFEADSLPSTTDPLLNPDGLSISENSPLRNAGWDKRAIGCFQIAHSTEADTVGVWTLDDIVEDAGKFKLAVDATVGTATSSLIEVFSRVRTILSIQSPDFVINPYTGETIGRLASDRTPYTVSVEVQYSTNGTTTNGTWLRVPIGTKPMHDTVNDVGNDDPLFDITNAVAIKASHLQYRVTLRNNETPLV